jgi:hypothetical protein
MEIPHSGALWFNQSFFRGVLVNSKADNGEEACQSQGIGEPKKHSNHVD